MRVDILSRFRHTGIVRLSSVDPSAPKRDFWTTTNFLEYTRKMVECYPHQFSIAIAAARAMRSATGVEVRITQIVCSAVRLQNSLTGNVAVGVKVQHLYRVVET